MTMHRPPPWARTPAWRRGMWRRDASLIAWLAALVAVCWAMSTAEPARASTGDECDLAVLPSAIDDEPTRLERRIIEQAAKRCPNARWRPVDPWRLWRLLEHEERAGMPASVRGLVLAAACQESGYVEDGRRGDGGRARGLLQLWPWYSDRYGVDRGDDDHSAEVWLLHLVRQLPGTERVCRRVGKRWRESASQALWRRASARAVRSHRRTRCNESTGHWRRLLRWQRAMARDMSHLRARARATLLACEVSR